jgi:hypothetical protein
MKALRISCFILGLLSFARMFYPVVLYKNPAEMPQQNSPALMVVSIATAVICAVICVILAGKLHRSTVGWGIFGFFVSFIACFILPFLKEIDPATKGTSWWNTAGSSGSSWNNNYGGTSYYSEKTCTSCHRIVPSTSRPGQHCPHCGVYWSTESTKRKY